MSRLCRGSPIGFSGSGILLILRPGYGILKEKGDETKRCVIYQPRNLNSSQVLDNLCNDPGYFPMLFKCHSLNHPKLSLPSKQHKLLNTRVLIRIVSL